MFYVGSIQEIRVENIEGYLFQLVLSWKVSLSHNIEAEI